MGEIKTKKSSFEKVIIVFNVISIILMVGIIITSLYMSGGLYKSYGPPSLKYSINNDDITIYEGVNAGSEIKQLVEAVNRSNMDNDGTELVVSINGRTNENQYTFNGDSARKYKVEIEYYNDLVSNINIYKSNTQNETNNINIDYTEFAEITGIMQEGSTQKTYNIDYESGLIEICIWTPFIVINIVVYCKYKSNAKKMNTNLYNEEEIKRKQKSLLLLLLFTDIVSCFVSYFWLKHLEHNIINKLSCI